MHSRNTVVLWLVSGVAWGVIAFGIAYSESSIGTTGADVWRRFLGGLISAPVIGMLIGRMSRNFLRYGRWGQAMLSLGCLHLAVFLFFLAAGFSGMVGQRTFGALVENAVFVTLFGLTATGYILVLWPLAYVNHLLVGKVQDRPEPEGELTRR